MSVLMNLEEYDCTVGKTSSSAYSSKVLEICGGSMVTKAEPLMILTSATGFESGKLICGSRMAAS